MDSIVAFAFVAVALWMAHKRDWIKPAINHATELAADMWLTIKGWWAGAWDELRFWAGSFQQGH